MKRIGNLKKKFLTKELIEEAIIYLCRSSKKNKWTPSNKLCWKNFLKNKESNINIIYTKLYDKTFKFDRFKIFKRFENKKERVIYASYPKDQIVDYILDKCLKYVFIEKKKLIHPNSYGSIKGKGQHEIRQKIIDKVKRKTNIYVAICDTKHYYPTINHRVMMKYIRQHIKDEWVIWLVESTLNRIKDSKGMALGLASSNILGHIYHSYIDWEMTTVYGIHNYFRFCDDKIMIHSDKNYLHSMVRVLKNLVENDEQEIKPNWKVVNCETQRFEFLGALINSRNAILSTYSRRRIERRFKKEIKQNFNYKLDSDRVLRIWAGIKGGLNGLEVRNLIRWWVLKSKYKEFFRRLYQAMIFIDQGRKGEVPNKIEGIT